MDSKLTTRFVPVFKENGEQYIFVGIIGYGAQATAQLVLHVSTGEYRVRKAFREYRVRKAFRPDSTRQQLELSGQSTEKNILQLLWARAKHSGVNPHIVTIHGSAYVATGETKPSGPGAGEELLKAVIYLGYCNGGDIFRLQNASSAIMVRMLAQLMQALRFIHDAGVSHNDLHAGNVFVNFTHAADGSPDFYLGDFGLATFHPHGSPERKPAFDHDMTCLWSLFNSRRRDVVGLKLQAVIDEAARVRRIFDDKGSLPDLEGLFLLAQQGAADTPLTEMDLQCFQKTAAPSITHWASEEGALQSLDGGEAGIHGPFQLGTVFIDWTGAFKGIQSIKEWVSK